MRSVRRAGSGTTTPRPSRTGSPTPDDVLRSRRARAVDGTKEYAQRTQACGHRPLRQGALSVGPRARELPHPRGVTMWGLSSRSSDDRPAHAHDAGAMTRTVDVLDGNTFVVSDERGDIDGSPVEVHGLFDRDTRYLSRWILTIDGQRLSTLSVDRTRYYAAQFFLAPGVASMYVNATLAVIRRRIVLEGFHEVVTLVNHATEHVDLDVVLEAAADFADLFEVKDATVDAKPGRSYRQVEPDRLVLGYQRETYQRETWIRADADAV